MGNKEVGGAFRASCRIGRSPMETLAFLSEGYGKIIEVWKGKAEILIQVRSGSQIRVVEVEMVRSDQIQDILKTE